MVKKRKDEQTQTRILEAARKIFVTRGMAGARMQEIADEAGINKALLHYYFRDKDQLFETVFAEQAQKFFPRLNMIFESDLPLFEKIEKFVQEYIDELTVSPYLPWFVMNEINRDPDRFLAQTWTKDRLPNPAKLLMQIEAEVKRGAIRPIQPINLLMNMVSMVVFPYIGRPMFERHLGMPEQRFMQLMEARKKEIPQFIIAAIRN